jgi:TRAP transporter TAXI family solute receptor
MIRMRTMLVLLCSLVSITTIATLSFGASRVVPLYTPPSGGPGYMMGAALASLVKKYVPGVEMVVEPTTGTLEMLRLLQERQGMKREAFAQIGAPDVYDAFKGRTGTFVGKPYSDVRALTFLYGSTGVLVVSQNSPIKSYADLKGKRVGVGGAGSSTAIMCLAVAEAHGVKRDAFKPIFYGYKETAEGIADKSLDAGFFPLTTYAELVLTNDVRIVPVDEPMIKKVTATLPYYVSVIKAKSYKGVEQDIPTMSFAVALFTYKDVSEDTVYNVLRALYEHLPEFQQVHLMAKQTTPGNALNGISVPFHPGAEKYFKEIGVMKK